ncbi:hypothetical protein NPIL_625791 [Nephila pilipes]|uniref:Uncharacterized protein n=1 Tax=Nephila pilipes TaxID=299642 RepID=A0A8X6Q1D7_NEPPI|nr:hypothetical protein NPIL_625791 [Nephila pilipes]
MFLVQRLELQDIYLLQRVDFFQEMTKPVLMAKTEDRLIHAMDVVNLVKSNLVVQSAVHLVRIPLHEMEKKSNALWYGFFQDAVVFLHLKDQNWYLNDILRRKFEFAKDANTCNINTMTIESNSCQLREDDSHKLPSEGNGKLNALLKKY